MITKPANARRHCMIASPIRTTEISMRRTPDRYPSERTYGAGRGAYAAMAANGRRSTKTNMLARGRSLIVDSTDLMIDQESQRADLSRELALEPAIPSTRSLSTDAMA
jgi:hypothetical protein